MIKVTVAIPHADTPWFLRACLESIAAQQHPEIELEVLVADQTRDDKLHKEVCAVVAASAVPTKLVYCRHLGSGSGLDRLLKFSTGEYFCSLDCDAWPIHKNWLWMPVQLVNEGVAQWVGNDTGLALGYKEKGDFVHLNNYYRVSKTDMARDVSRAVGFIRWDSRWEIGFVASDYYWESLGGTVKCDNGVVAMHHTRNHTKLHLPITRYLGATPQVGIYGMVIDDLVFHLVFARNFLQAQDPLAAFGPDFCGLYKRLSSEPITRATVEYLVNETRPYGAPVRRIGHDGADAALNAHIEELKQS